MGRESMTVGCKHSLETGVSRVSSLDARMAEWQTRAAQNRLSVRTCGFKSHSGHCERAGQRAYGALRESTLVTDWSQHENASPAPCVSVVDGDVDHCRSVFGEGLRTVDPCTPTC